MKSHFAVFAGVLFLLALPLSALEVNETELKSTGTADTIVFINYTGPHAKIDSLESIKKLGSDLGAEIAKSPSEKMTAGSSARYSVIHAVDENEKSKLDADIILIGKDAAVDHIDNLRHIIASYLSSAYGYSEKDAETVAVFVTVYNAVYRADFTSFQNKYKKIVTDNLTSSNCGLSVNYKDWSGASQIVIPLFDVNGGISTVDTSVISDSQVVKNMQEDDDKNIESRKNMVDIKEREAEQATEKAQAAQKTAVEEQKKLEAEKTKTQEVKKEAETAKEQAKEAQKTAEANPDDRQAQAEAKEKQAIAEEKQAEYEQQQTAEQKQQAVAEEAKQTAAEQQAVADKKNTEAQEERKVIAQDQQEVIKKEIADAAAPSAYGIELTNEASMLSGMIKINTNNGQIIKASPVTYIRNRTIFQAGDSFIAIAGENSRNGAVKLILLSPDTMEIQAESNEIVAENSVLIQDGSDYYCVIKDGSSWVLAKYDQNLSLKLKSPVAVKSSTPVTVASQYIIVTGADGAVKLLNKSDLTVKNAVSSSYNDANAK